MGEIAAIERREWARCACAEGIRPQIPEMPWKNTLARVYSLLRNQPEGYLDSVDQNAAIGWAFDHASPSRPVEVELLVDGVSAGTFTANAFRADLAQAGRGDGYHGFEIPLPQAALDGGAHQVSVRAAGRGILRGSPRTVTSAGSPGAGHALDRPGHVRGAYNPGLPPPEIESIADPRAAEAALQPLSVVIPTYNRGALMEDNVRAAIAIARGLDVEFLLVDDGSTDDTPRRLAALAREFPNVRWERLSNGGPGRARNAGVAMSRNELVLFLGDDTRPASQDFFIHHIRAHHWLPKPEIAVLGKIVWPNQPNEYVNFVMSHIQGAGQEQFGYFSLMPYTWLDWRFFYTANVSFKKSLAGEWPANGFSSEFPLASYEDGEFAYRLTKKTDGRFRILYTPGAVVTHHHNYSVQQFINRQISAGLMARVLTRLHPELAAAAGIAQVEAALATPDKSGQDQIEDFLSVIEGVKSWAKILDKHYQLGSQNWHADFLRAVFILSYLQGYVMGNENPEANLAAAYRYILERFQERMSSVASFEALGRLVRMPVI